PLLPRRIGVPFEHPDPAAVVDAHADGLAHVGLAGEERRGESFGEGKGGDGGLGGPGLLRPDGEQEQEGGADPGGSHVSYSPYLTRPAPPGGLKKDIDRTGPGS